MRAPQGLVAPLLQQDRFTLTCDVLPEGTRLMRLSGSEGLSQLYSFSLEVVMPEEEGLTFDMEKAVNSLATLHIHHPNSASHSATYHGMLAEVDWVQEVADHAVYRLLLVPRLWQLSLNQHSNVYVNKGIEAIIADVMKANGFTTTDYEFRLDPANKYDPLPHVSQYRESDLAFLQRRMEREGLYYFFEHTGERETLVITDTKLKHKQNGTIKYFPSRDVTGVEAFSSVTCRRQARPKLVRLREFDHVHPTADLKREVDVSPTGQGEVVSHDENYTTSSEGKRLAQVRAEELRARELLFEASGCVLDVKAGALFHLTDHPRFDGDYLTVRVEHEGTQGVQADAREPHPQVYTVRVEAIPAKTQYRPPRRTPVPRIYGTEMGVVDGEQASDYAQLDEHGRYKVHLFFDEVEGRNGKASTWVRMLQPHGGSEEGFHFPLRKGTEVMVVFLGGDPDRPVIAGVVPNSHTPSPVTQDNLTQNVLLTASGNLMRMEDARGSEHIHLSTPNQKTGLFMGAPNKDGFHLHLTTQGNAHFDIGKNLKVTVGERQDETVTGPVVETYKDTQDTHVTKKRTLTVDDLDDTHAKSQKVETQEDRTVTVKGAQKHEVTKTDHHVITGMQTIEANGGQDIKVGSAGRKENIGGLLDQTTKDQKILVNGSVTETITNGVTITSPAGYKIIAPEFTVVAPTKHFKTGPWSGEAIGAKVGFVGVKHEDVGVSNANTFFKCDVTVTKIDLNVLKVDQTLVRKQNDPMKISEATLELKKQVVALYMSTIIMFS